MSHYDPILRGRPERCPTCDEFNILYGFGFVSDPRDFMPDEDCSTPEERQRWRDDCARVKAGRPAEHLPRGCQHSTYGLGTYWAPFCEHEQAVAA